jgi:AraC-like DNA-binding protein
MMPRTLSGRHGGSKMKPVMMRAEPMLVDVPGSSATPALARFVDRFEVWTPTPSETRKVDLLPDGGASMLVRVHADGKYDAGVRGPRTRAHYKFAAALPLMVRVLFKPGGAYPFFGVPMDSLTDAIAPLEVLWGDPESMFRDDLLAAHTAGRDVVSVISRHLVTRMRTRPFEPPSVLAARAAVERLARGERLDDVARAVGISHRHLRRAFGATVGLAPKTYSRIARFRRAFSMAENHPCRWGDVARAAGYFDQSHLNAEFRELALLSPTSLREPPPRRQC